MDSILDCYFGCSGILWHTSAAFTGSGTLWVGLQPIGFENIPEHLKVLKEVHAGEGLLSLCSQTRTQNNLVNQVDIKQMSTGSDSFLFTCFLLFETLSGSTPQNHPLGLPCILFKSRLVHSPRGEAQEYQLSPISSQPWICKSLVRNTLLLFFFAETGVVV